MAAEWLRADQVAALAVGHDREAHASAGPAGGYYCNWCQEPWPCDVAALAAQDGRWRALVGELLAAYCAWLVAAADAGCDLPTQGSTRLLAACKAVQAALADAPPAPRGAAE
jgi:hypothetical protein